MSIADDVRHSLPEFRASALALMVDTAVITRPGGEPTFDSGTGVLTPAAGTEVYEGACRLRQPTAGESQLLFGDEPMTRTRFIACLPHDTTGIAVGDLLTMTVSTDPDVLERTFEVMSVPLATFTLYKGYPVEVIE